MTDRFYIIAAYSRPLTQLFMKIRLVFDPVICENYRERKISYTLTFDSYIHLKLCVISSVLI
jgi:hypothetical protein